MATSAFISGDKKKKKKLKVRKRFTKTISITNIKIHSFDVV